MSQADVTAERRSDLDAAGEFAEVALGGLTIGFAWVDRGARRDGAELASLVLFRFPSWAGPERGDEPPCGCRSDDLAFARIRSRVGATWRLGVRVCATHRRLRMA